MFCILVLHGTLAAFALSEAQSPVALHTLRHDTPVLSFDVSSDSIVAIPRREGGLNQDVVVWHSESLKRTELTLERQELSFSCVAFASADRLVLGTWNGEQAASIEVWDLRLRRRNGLLQGHRSGVRSLAISQDGAVAFSGSDDGDIKRWDLKTTSCVGTSSRGGRSEVNDIAISSDSTAIATATWDSVVRLWNSSDLHLRAELRGHDGEVTSVAFLPKKSDVVSAGWDRTIRIWDVERLEARHIIRVPGDAPASSIAVSEDGRYLLAGTGQLWTKGGEVMLWDLETREQIASFKAHAMPITKVMFARKPGEFLTSSYDGTVKIWTIKTMPE